MLKKKRNEIDKNVEKKRNKIDENVEIEAE